VIIWRFKFWFLFSQADHSNFLTSYCQFIIGQVLKGRTKRSEPGIWEYVGGGGERVAYEVGKVEDCKPILQGCDLWPRSKVWLRQKQSAVGSDWVGTVQVVMPEYRRRARSGVHCKSFPPEP
jgi:hypothetical protein